MRDFTIGQLAKKAQVNVETIRYYERRGLIPAPPRSESGYRRYSQNVATRIKFIKRAKELGFTLNEIAELLALQTGPDTNCGDIKTRAQAKLADIEARIRDLERIREVLSELVATCAGRGPTSECPILQALASTGEV